MTAKAPTPPPTRLVRDGIRPPPPPDYSRGGLRPPPFRFLPPGTPRQRVAVWVVFNPARQSYSKGWPTRFTVLPDTKELLKAGMFLKENEAYELAVALKAFKVYRTFGFLNYQGELTRESVRVPEEIINSQRLMRAAVHRTGERK